MQAVDVREPNADQQMHADLARLVALVEESRIDEARVLATNLATRWPDSPPIQHMRRVLEPPKAVTSAAGAHHSLERERAWLRAHAHEYPGRWLMEATPLTSSAPNLVSCYAVE